MKNKSNMLKKNTIFWNKIQYIEQKFNIFKKSPVFWEEIWYIKRKFNILQKMQYVQFKWFYFIFVTPRCFYILMLCLPSIGVFFDCKIFPIYTSIFLLTICSWIIIFTFEMRYKS